MENKQRKIVRIAIPVIEGVLALFGIYSCAERGFAGLPFTWLFNVTADMICMFIILFFIMGIVFGRAVMGKKYSLFLLICHANFFALFLDFCSWMFDGNPEMRALLYGINTSLYIVNLLLTVAYARFVVEMTIYDEKKKKDLFIFTFSLLVITVITRIMNIKYGYFFTVGMDGVYARGEYQYLSYVYTILMQGVIIVLLIKSDITKGQKTAVLAFTILPFTAAVVSMFIYGLSLMYACVLISIVMIYSAFFVELETDKDRILDVFEKYVSNDVVQKIVDNPNGKMIPGKRYNATIMVSDIRGFTAISEGMDPDDLVEMLNHYIGSVTEIIARFGGIVTEFLGDGLMCVFGAPHITDDYAQRAIACALTIQEKMPEINRWNVEHSYPEIEMGIGINTGTVVLGSLGSESRAKYTAVGQTIDRAFEIESCSVGRQVLISNSTLRAVKDDLEVDFLYNFVPDPTQLVKVQIYEVYHIGGRWNAGRRRMTEAPRYMKKPLDAKIMIVIGKQTDVEIHEARITMISADAVVFETKADLSELDNIRISISGFGEILYAKVQNNNNGSVLAAITFRPKDFRRWLATL